MYAVKAAKPQSITTSRAPSLQRRVGAATNIGEGRDAFPGPLLDLSRIPVFRPEPAPRPPVPALQAKLAIGESSDPLETEADDVARQIMRMPAPVSSVLAAPTRLSRKCAGCGAEKQDAGLRPKPVRPMSAGGEAPDIVHSVLRSPGRPLDASARSFFEPRFQTDLSGVRIHVGPDAAASADAVNARAYTVGRNIAFAGGQYRPTSTEGRALIAHELAHVGQQGGAPGLAGRVRPLARPTLRRANRDAVRQVMKMHSVVGAGIQFFPRNVRDTRIGPVAVQGGLTSHGTSRLNVIIGANISPQILAREILPLWTTATPFVPPGGGPTIRPGRLSEVQLAQALLVYNQNYLPVPAMTEWRAGLHFPLPVEIDEATGIATLDPDAIRTLAAAFDPAWTPLLRQRAAATVAPPAADVQAEVGAFLAAEPTLPGRSAALRDRAITNAQAALPFVREAFVQLGIGGFDVALAMLDGLGDRDVGLLAAERDGAAILALLRAALAAAPAAPGAPQQASLDRANAMLAGVAGVRAANRPTRVPGRAERTVSVDTVYLRGSRFNPGTALTVANMIYAQCNVRFSLGGHRSATLAQTTGWLGADRILTESPDCGAASAEELAMFQGATAAFRLGSRIRAFFVLDTTTGNSYSVPPYCATGPAAPLRNMAVISNSGDIATLAHEMGHILLNSDDHPAGTLMTEGWPQPNEIPDADCATMYNNA